MKQITVDEMNEMIDLYNSGKSIQKKRFWCQENNHYVELDNTDDECYVSDWETKEECFMRAMGYITQNGVPFDYQEIYTDFFKLVNHIIQFEGSEAGNVFESMGLPRELADY